MFDLIIKNGTIVDGTGKEKYIADIAIKGDRIVKIEKHIQDRSKQEIDATGNIVCPGFIDTHTHIDETILFYPENKSYLLQGVTTFIGGNCGTSAAPVGEQWLNVSELFTKSKKMKPKYYELYNNWKTKDVVKEYKELYDVNLDYITITDFFNKIKEIGISNNYYPLVGHGNIRNIVMGENKNRVATEQEVEEMKILLNEVMQEGVRGMSTGLDYPPGAYSTTEEIIELAKIVEKNDGIYCSHVRARNMYTESKGDVDMYGGFKEAFEIGRQAKIPVHVSHVYGVDSIEETKKMFLDAKNEGVDVSYDVISSTSAGIINYIYLAKVTSPWFLAAGSLEQFEENLKDQYYIENMKRDMVENFWVMTNEKTYPIITDMIRIVSCKDKKFELKKIKEIMDENNWTYQDTLINILKADILTKVKIGTETSEEQNSLIKELLDFELAMPCSDFFAVDENTLLGYPTPLEILPHPNGFNAFVKYLTMYRTNNLEESIKKATGYVAERFNIVDRGKLLNGKYADILIYNPAKLDLNESIYDTRRYPKGVEYVIVNGEVAIKNGYYSGARSGRILSKN